MKGGQCELAPLLLWDPVAKAGSKGRNVLAGREGQDDLVAEVWRAAQPKRLIGSLNRDTGASPCGDYPGIAHWRDLAGAVERSKKKRPVELAALSLRAFRGRYRSQESTNDQLTCTR